MKTYVDTEPHIKMFIVSLFIIAPTCEQAKCLLTEELIDDMWYVLYIKWNII